VQEASFVVCGRGRDTNNLCFGDVLRARVFGLMLLYCACV